MNQHFLTNRLNEWYDVTCRKCLEISIHPFSHRQGNTLNGWPIHHRAHRKICIPNAQTDSRKRANRDKWNDTNDDSSQCCWAVISVILEFCIVRFKDQICRPIYLNNQKRQKRYVNRIRNSNWHHLHEHHSSMCTSLFNFHCGYARTILLLFQRHCLQRFGTSEWNLINS